MTLLPGRVVAYCLPLEMIECQTHRRKRGRSNGNASLNTFRKIHGPTQGLHPANGAADDSMQSFNTKVIEQPRLCADHISNSHDGKVATVNLSCPLGMGTGWSRRAITRPDNVHAYDTVAPRIKWSIWPAQLR